MKAVDYCYPMAEIRRRRFIALLLGFNLNTSYPYLTSIGKRSYFLV